MIEITASVAAALAAFEQILLSKGVENPMRFLRKVDPKHHESEVLVEMRIIYWVNNNPGVSRVVDIVMGETKVGWLPFSAHLETAADEWTVYVFRDENNHFKPGLK